MLSSFIASEDDVEDAGYEDEVDEDEGHDGDELLSLLKLLSTSGPSSGCMNHLPNRAKPFERRCLETKSNKSSSDKIVSPDTDPLM